MGNDNCKTTPQVVDKVDLDRYLGRWYEIARLTVPYDINCSLSKATYIRNDVGNITSIAVTNECSKESEVITFNGIATPTDDAIITKDNMLIPGKLSIRFFGMPMSVDYFILALDQDNKGSKIPYKYAMIGTPDRKNLWIIVRTSNFSSETYKMLVDKATQLGFKASDLKLSQQIKI